MFAVDQNVSAQSKRQSSVSILLTRRSSFTLVAFNCSPDSSTFAYGEWEVESQADHGDSFIMSGI